MPKTKLSKRKARVEFRKALETATASTASVAKEIGIARASVYVYLRGHHPVPPEVAKRFAKYLRKRARTFDRAADRLESAAKE